MAASLRIPSGFFDVRIKFSTHIDPLTVNNKSIEIKHDICSKLNVMFENYMVSISLPMLYFNAIDMQEQFAGAL